MKTLQFLRNVPLYFAFLFALTLFLFSCNQNKIENEVVPTLSTIENFLTFESMDEFNKIAQKMAKAPYSEVISLEKQRNFVSLRTLLKEAEEVDAINHEKEMKIAEENPVMAKTMTHQIPKVIRDNPNSFFYSNEEGIRLNLIRTELATLLNKDGIVKVGGKIIQYKSAYTKVIEDGNVDKIALLKTTATTDKTAGISVHPVRFRNSNKRLDYAYSRSCEGGYGSPLQYRIIVYEEAFDFEDYSYHYYVGGLKIRTLKRGFLGGWYNHATRSQSGDGNVSYNFANNPSSWNTWVVNYTGNYSFNNNNGNETSEYTPTFFLFKCPYSYYYQYPEYANFQPQFNSSSTHTWTFGTGGPCSI